MSQESDIFSDEQMGDLLADPMINAIIDGNWSENEVTLQVPTHATGEFPSCEKWEGCHSFSATVQMSGTNNKPYVVSEKIKRLYVPLGFNVPFMICWDGTEGLFVRALMVFTAADILAKPVKRCINHRQEDHTLNQGYEHVNHVLACENRNTEYAVDKDTERHSIRVPLEMQDGADFSLLNLKFMCLNSCTGGINRSNTNVIFTLEDKSGRVLGRESVSVKICMSPKRDKKKDEVKEDEEKNEQKYRIKRKRKFNEELEDDQKPKIECYSDFNPTSFTVTVSSPEVAVMLKNHLKWWEAEKRVELAAASPLVIDVQDTVV